MKDADRRLVFAVASSADGVPFIMIGLPKQAYADLVADPEMGKDADLTHVNIPVRLSIFACDDFASGQAKIKKWAEAAGITLTGDPNREFPTRDLRN